MRVLLVEDDLALGLAQTLHNHLFGGLCGDAAGMLCDGAGDNVLADGGRRVNLLRIGQEHHGFGFFHLGAVFYDGADGVNLHLPGVRVKHDGDALAFRYSVTFVRGDKSFLDGAQNDAMRESSFGCELCYCKEQVTLHSCTFRF